LRNGPLLDWPDWFAGHAIEDVREALLGHLDNRFDRPSVDADVRENGSRRWIEIPQVVMRQLEVPHTLTAVRLHAHEALTKEVVAKAVAAVHVTGWRSDGHVHVAEVLVGAEERPHRRLA
jgi:hypothetical protein